MDGVCLISLPASSRWLQRPSAAFKISVQKFTRGDSEEKREPETSACAVRTGCFIKILSSVISWNCILSIDHLFAIQSFWTTHLLSRDNHVESMAAVGLQRHLPPTNKHTEVQQQRETPWPETESWHDGYFLHSLFHRKLTELSSVSDRPIRFTGNVNRRAVKKSPYIARHIM